ncbi:CynX/NimT family MFS transporter [Myroides sp. LJL119]
MNNFSTSEQKGHSSLKRAFMFLGVIFVASNLRAPLTCVGPVLEQIRLEFSLSNTAVGLLSTIPLMCFAFLSAFIPRLSKKWGMSIVLLGSIVLLTIGLLVRPLGSVVSLFLGAALVGMAITVGNVLMPAYIKVNFPKSVGLMTGIYSASMNLVAALAAGFSIYLGEFTQLGWKGSIGIWSVLACLSIFVWLPSLSKSKLVSKKDKSIKDLPDNINMYRNKIAWCVTIFMGLQSLLFYCIAAWLPKVTQSWGMDVIESGWLLSYVQFAQLPMTFIGAVVAGKMKNQKPLAVLVGLVLLLGIGGIILFKTQYILLCCILIGLGSGLAFSLCMILFVLRTNNAQQAAKLSAMAQALGYSIAAIGPPLFGYLYDQTNNWNASFIFLFIASLILLVVGYIASQDKLIE